ncbi:protein of unknown function [Methylorubrum extorquens DM4]|uniref:Uncharacterized protein n=1 Tax=Methylorubrum extorquens (strain DSM 6343 / CIP 106787 / DM4) TaxID=661410 RepID=C7CBN6_METED|nr:protein of unknown function [Methylorubrum extorquens DM4]
MPSFSHSLGRKLLLSISPRNPGFAPLPDLQPQPLEWPLFARKRPLLRMVGPGGYKLSGRERRTRRLSQDCRGRARPRPARLDKVENQLDRFRAEEFWDRVMQEIAELLVERGPLTPAEILTGLRAVTLRGAT